MSKLAVKYLLPYNVRFNWNTFTKARFCQIFAIFIAFFVNLIAVIDLSAVPAGVPSGADPFGGRIGAAPNPWDRFGTAEPAPGAARGERSSPRSDARENPGQWARPA